MSDQLRSLAAYQRRRLLATVLGALEKQVWSFLDEGERQALRSKIVQAVDAYHDVFIDVSKVYEDMADTSEHVVNQEVLQLLRMIHREVKQ